MTQREPLPPINFTALADALLSRSDHLVPMWLPGGSQLGHEYRCGSLSGGSGTSCSVNLTNGKWSDFATGEAGGDLVSLYAAINGLTPGKAAVQVAREEGLEDVANVQRGSSSPGEPAAPRPPRPAPEPKASHQTPHKSDEGWRSTMLVPPTAPAATFRHQHRAASDIEHTATYRMDGQLLGYVVRFRTSDGGKETLPYTWCTSARDGASRWHWKTWDEPRPLYFPNGASPGSFILKLKPPPTVVLVEGEKKADILQALLDASAPGVYLVASWAGGCKAWKKATWAWLADTTVLLWPDCDGKREPLSKKVRDSVIEQVQTQLTQQLGGQITDADRERSNAVALDLVQRQKPLLPVDKQPGMSAMLGIGALLRDEHACKVQLLPIPQPLAVPDGWDCADAITTDGWDFDVVLAFFASAYTLPGSPGEPATADRSVKPKKIDGPGDPGEGDSDNATAGDSVKIGGKQIPRWLAYYYDADKAKWFTSRKMVIACLEHDPLLMNVLGLNELSNNIEVRAAWPWVGDKMGPLTGSADILLGDYLTRTYGLPSIPRAALVEAIETVAHKQPYHPLRQYFEALRWDGTSRIDKWLVYAIGETPETLTPALVEYLSRVGRYWLLGMVNRIMEPGCKFDYCPVLEGPGGLGKSTLVEALAGSEYFSDAHFDLSRGKDGQEQVQGRWLYELAELANFGKSEINLIKAFISSKVDRYRPSYGRTVEAYARQCVLVGTTNENTYLRDRTGNRRFWPIPVRTHIRIAWLRKFRDELLAEAYVLYQAGTPYTPSPAEELKLFVPMQESRLVETAVLSEMTHVLTRPTAASGIGAIVNTLTDFVTISQLCLALGVDAAKSNPGLEAQIRGWLDHEGWPRVKRQINGVRAWGYERPANWPPLELPDPQPPVAQGAAGASGATDSVNLNGGDDNVSF